MMNNSDPCISKYIKWQLSFLLLFVCFYIMIQLETLLGIVLCMLGKEAFDDTYVEKSRSHKQGKGGQVFVI